MDYTAANLLHQMQDRLVDQGGTLLFSGMPTRAPSEKGVESYLERMVFARAKESARVFDTRDAALVWMEERILDDAGWRAEDSRALDIGELELFRELDDDALTALRDALEPMTLQAGESLFVQGDPGATLFFVRRGTIDVLIGLAGNKRHHVAAFGRGDYVGEMSFLDKGKRSAFAEARTETELYALPRERFNAIALERPVVATMVFARLALLVSRRLRVANREVSALEER